MFEKEATFKSNSTQGNFHLIYLEGNPSTGTLSESFRKFDYYILYSAPKIEWLLVNRYGWEEEFKEEDKKSQKATEKINQCLRRRGEP